MTTSVILFAHGSRDPLWRLPIQAVAAEITKRQAGVQVRCAYLELTEPTLPQAAAQLVAAGARNIRVLPLFLGVGKHAREDLPLLISEVRAAHPGVDVQLLATVGENPALIALMAEIALVDISPADITAPDVALPDLALADVALADLAFVGGS